MTLVNRKLIKLNDRGVRNVSEFGSVGVGSMTFIKKLTASSSATLSFVDGASDVVLDSTYKEYLFTFKDIHPGTDSKALQFNLSADSGSNYNVTKTTTFFRAQHTEDGGANVFEYVTGDDLAQSTSAQNISNVCGSDNDQCVSGYLHLFNPSSTTFVKHYIARTNSYTSDDKNMNAFIGGYCNVTVAIDAVQFKFSGGNIDAGTFKMYGVN